MNFKDILGKLKSFSFFFSKDIIGLDFGNSSMKGILIKKIGEEWNVVDYFYEELPPNLRREMESPERREEIVKRLKNIFTTKFKGVKKIATAIKGNQVIVRNVKFPKMSPQDFDKTLQFEAEPYIAFDIRDVYLSAQILRDVIEDDQIKMETILVAAKRDYVDSIISLLNQIGISPSVIEVDAFSIVNLYEINNESFFTENIMFLDIGSTITNLIITENGYPKVARDIFTGSNDITLAISNNLGLDFEESEELKKKYGIVSTIELEEMDNPDEAEQVSGFVRQIVDDLISEVRRSLDYFNTMSEIGGEVSKIVLSGGGAKLRNLINYFNLQLNIPCEIIDPWKKIIPSDEFLKTHTPEFAVSLGLALRREKDTK